MEKRVRVLRLRLHRSGRQSKGRAACAAWPVTKGKKKTFWFFLNFLYKQASSRTVGMSFLNILKLINLNLCFRIVTFIIVFSVD